jgi:hypothetical protein
MLRSESLHTVEREEKLKIHRLLGPKGTVVVEGGDPFFDGYEVGAVALRDLLDEGGDGFLRRCIVPGRQGIGGEARTCRQHHGDYDQQTQPLHRRLLRCEPKASLWVPGF